ncbi:MAG: hypothetical protein NTZ05_05430, partial [Chloroflexi bacterium]|nr:hypothetical protein [Chloroflexota bacterium]
MRIPARVPLLALAAVFLAFGLFRFSATPSAVAAGAVITVAPNTGLAGTTARATGSGFFANEVLQISWHSETTESILGNATADASGNLSGMNFVVPNVAPGTYSVWALGPLSWTTATFRVTAATTPTATATAKPAPTATATPTASPSPTATPAPPASTRQDVGPSGGDIHVGGGADAGGVGVSFPPGALSGGATVLVAFTNTAPTGVTAPSGTVLLNRTIEVTPDQPVVLNKRVRIRISLAGIDLGGRSLEVPFERNGKPYILIDTAGLRRRGKVFEAIEKFSVTSASSPAPTLSTPADGATLPSLAANLTWTNPVGATQYQIQVIPFNGDGPGTNLIRGVATSYAVTAPDFGGLTPNYMMLPDMTYTWRVRTTSKATFAPEDDPSWSAWSLRLFRTPAVSTSGIRLTSPAAGGTVATLAPTLVWTNRDAQVFYYEVQLSKDPAFNADPATAIASVYWELRHGAVTTPPNSYTVPASFPLEPATPYFWRVRPRVQGDGTTLA